MAILSLDQYQDLPFLNPYIVQMLGEYRPWTMDRAEASEHRGRWRALFGKGSEHPLDLEIGVGNGYFFSHFAKEHPERSVLGIEIKFKPLIQTVRRTLGAGAKDFRLLRVDASQLHYFFSPGELNDVYIYFPDPWPKKRAWKHRLIQTEFLEVLWSLQAPGSRVEIKTDDRPYFDWILERAEASKYFPERTSFDLHRSEWAAENYQTHFEKLWTRKGLPTHYLRLRRNLAPKGVTHA